MIFKKFKYVSIFYLSIIILITGVGVYVLFNTYFWLTSIWIFAIDIVIAVIFLKFVSKEHRKLSHFLISVNQDDFNPPYTKSFEDLDFNQAFEKLSKVIISLRNEAQINYQYIQTIVNQINTSIICVDESNKIVLSNSSSNTLFNKNVLRNIDSLQISNEDLPALLRNFKINEKKLIKIKICDELCNYSVQLAEFKLLKNRYRLFSFHNVQSELEQNELESWQKLTRVMAHEIMNSAIPISNLSGLVYNKLFNEKDEFIKSINKDQEEDVKEGLQTIESRSKGLVNFVEATRNFTKMPKPELNELKVVNLINRTESLLKVKLLENKIDFKVNIESDELKIIADKSLIEQVLINLLVNAIDAVQESDNPAIKIDVLKNKENHTFISIEDNGKGIEEDNLENIFIPFFTTKREGSGIGLSLAKQIMFLHKGSINVRSIPQIGTKFVLSF